MAYDGYLLVLGDWEFPQKYIAADTYSVYVSMQDVDPWTDANGYLHRNAVELKALKAEFETRAMLTNIEFSNIMQNIQSQYISATERSLNVTVYIPEYDDYVTQKAYFADFQPKIYGTYNEIIHYNPIRFAFIGGVA